MSGFLFDSNVLLDIATADKTYAAGWLASKAFLKYRQRGGSRQTPLPDFYIGAHAESEKLTLVTRDEERYRTYFQMLR